MMFVTFLARKIVTVVLSSNDSQRNIESITAKRATSSPGCRRGSWGRIPISLNPMGLCLLSYVYTQGSRGGNPGLEVATALRYKTGAMDQLSVTAQQCRIPISLTPMGCVFFHTSIPRVAAAATLGWRSQPLCGTKPGPMDQLSVTAQQCRIPISLNPMGSCLLSYVYTRVAATATLGWRSHRFAVQNRGHGSVERYCSAAVSNSNQSHPDGVVSSFIRLYPG